MGYTICFESFFLFFFKKKFWEKVDKEKNKMKTVVCVCVKLNRPFVFNSGISFSWVFENPSLLLL